MTARPIPDPASDDPRDDPFPNEPTPEEAELEISRDEGVERAGFGEPAE